ncbi:hypothetical protein [Saccharothrix lopnurensis]|uniref:Uncharacterized protein n=1 Tax=Saccharothrix lopnurensis TaxID=1670621 RepID=A0ABW1P361_9PSEU
MTRRAVNTALVFVCALSLVAIGVALLLRAERPAAAPPGTTTTTPATTAPAVPVADTCGEVAEVDAYGSPLPPAWLAHVRGAHRAACDRSYGALAEHMVSPYETYPDHPVERSAAEVTTRWRTEDPDGARLAVLAVTLELPGRLDQGGLVYCQPRGAGVVFARGTADRPGGLSAFSLVHGELFGLPSC